MKKLKTLALFLAAVILLSAVSGPALAVSVTVNISTPEQLLRLTDRCRLDSWSQGKTVVLLNDIDLTGYDFEPIPSFGGTFDGDGYTIRGLNISSGGSAVGGLFRYVQEGAVIREVDVEGLISPEMNAEGFGGIAGENSGKIINCSFSGTVSGRSDIGGIVGLNTASGEIYGCRNLGSVSGEHYTGGIAGRNLGSIINCTNLAHVNTTNSEVVSEELDLSWDDINSMENVAAHTDTGGIAGFSQGIVEGCVNRGNVGYPHVGYNVGGVAGRQSGYMNGCENFGAINGRKDVGGIVGQMVPAIRMQFSEGEVAALRQEMNTLQGLIDKMLVDFQYSSAEISGILADAGTYLESAGESASFIGDALVGFVDGNIESINTLTATIAEYTKRLSYVLGSVEDSIYYLTSASAYLSELMAGLGLDEEDAAELEECLNYAGEKLSQAGTELQSVLTIVYEALEQLTQALENGEDTETLAAIAGEAIARISTANEYLTKAAELVADALANGIEPALEAMGWTVTGPGELISPLQPVIELIGLARDSMVYAIDEFASWMYDLGREEPIVLKGFGKQFVEEADRMDAAFAGLAGELERLNTAVSGSTATISTDLRQVNEQFFKVMDSFMALLDSGDSQQSIYEDMSEEELFTAKDGKVEGCVNRGTVDGDVNVGGLVGTMAIEYDLDPEEDVSVSGSGSGTFSYFTNAVLLAGINYESVTGKKDDVGGAVGYMDLGIVYGCENYGSVASTSGDYVGGIAGQSAAVIKDSWALCSLSGRDYVGGIAGSCTDISGCRSIVEIDSTGGWQGAVAGEVRGECGENYFVGEGLGGIDGVSYAGKAEPCDYDSFVQVEGLPEEFLNFNLIFVTDSIAVKRVNFHYGDSIEPGDIPDVPEKEGYVGAWEEYDFDDLTFSGVVNAVYTPYATVVAVPDEIGKRPIVLLEGSFLPDAVPRLAKSEDSRSAFSALDEVLESWTVTVSGSVEATYRVRYLAPDEAEKLLIYVLRDGVWNPVGTETEGSYLIFEASGEKLSFAAVQKSEKIPVLWLALGGGALSLAILVVLLICLRRRKKRKLLQKASCGT